jgi:hypothetical protein
VCVSVPGMCKLDVNGRGGLVSRRQGSMTRLRIDIREFGCHRRSAYLIMMNHRNGEGQIGDCASAILGPPADSGLLRFPIVRQTILG